MTQWNWTYNDIVSTPLAPFITIIEHLTETSEEVGIGDFDTMIDAALDAGPAEEWE